MRRTNRGTNQIHPFLMIVAGALFPLLAEWTPGPVDKAPWWSLIALAVLLFGCFSLILLGTTKAIQRKNGKSVTSTDYEPPMRLLEPALVETRQE
ncbi:hypothetical protein CDG81_06120 [Actinopolyspora erythraea]|uniref:Uncharacterized protein n=1 Tax=Actinopolyspora erythraea TaxID=414996 RepID=A0A099D302_9ACTN|nr:hypothetical protein [Actinopolyspora erythraea]ASU77955.1 hypothetical protein CDG81_06120 [Actinopolyspora erythraea]KGI79715.1 hypothetical protein IL38_21140 [Actinopolyspora erythraea]